MKRRPDFEAIAAATKEEQDQLRRLAFGRLMRMASRPPEPGDKEMLDDIVDIFKTCDGTTHRPEEPVASILMRHEARFGSSGG